MNEDLDLAGSFLCRDAAEGPQRCRAAPMALRRERADLLQGQLPRRDDPLDPEPLLGEAKPGERFQFFRKGYYMADPELCTEDEKVFNKIVGLKSSFKVKK